MIDFARRLKEALATDWDPGSWVKVPGIVFVVNIVAVGLTGGGHAPFAYNLPLITVIGPLFFVYFSFPMHDMYFRNRWGDLVNLSIFVTPSILFLVYMLLLRVSAPDRRWFTLIVLATIHLGFALFGIHCFATGCLR